MYLEWAELTASRKSSLTAALMQDAGCWRSVLMRGAASWHVTSGTQASDTAREPSCEHLQIHRLVVIYLPKMIIHTFIKKRRSCRPLQQQQQQHPTPLWIIFWIPLIYVSQTTAALLSKVFLQMRQPLQCKERVNLYVFTDIIVAFMF